jgi:Kef-type K+ transport system membrane component KefB
MADNTVLLMLFFVFAGAAVFSTLALYTRQSLLVAYILLGIFLGPWGLHLTPNAQAVQRVGDVGIIFLLFLLGLHLQPQSLLHLLKKISWVAIASSIVFAMLGYILGRGFGFTEMESFIIGMAMMFSSTIIGLKLLPTTVLHHQHTGEVMIGILLLQDLIAIAVILLLNGLSDRHLTSAHIGIILFSLPGLLVFAFLFERFVLMKLFARFDRIREYMFLLAIAWCLGMSQLAELLGLSAEIGAFIAGVSIASSPISLYIAESLKPVRDFFLVLFFFAVGASFDLNAFVKIAFPAVLLAIIILILKPVVFQLLLRQVKEPKHVAWEVGFRLGQVSEFSLLISYIAAADHLISSQASSLIQAATILTFVVSSYFVVLKYPTPVAISEKLRRD